MELTTPHKDQITLQLHQAKVELHVGIDILKGYFLWIAKHPPQDNVWWPLLGPAHSSHKIKANQPSEPVVLVSQSTVPRFDLKQATPTKQLCSQHGHFSSGLPHAPSHSYRA